jgi:hypothetical protein
MIARVVMVALAVLIGALGFGLFDQGRRIERLEGELKALRSSVREGNDVPVAASPIYAPVPRPSSAAAAEPAAAPAVPARVEQRVAVTHDDVARVESAVLSLLEADRPELREKLRAVVQEQRQSLEQEQREERRERWATRHQARLLELGNEVGLTPAQQESILHITLATRDQIRDVRQSADSPEAINVAREKSRALREQSEAQIRALMKPDQYEAYRQRFEDDDDDDRRPRGRVPEGQGER